MANVDESGDARCAMCRRREVAHCSVCRPAVKRAALDASEAPVGWDPTPTRPRLPRHVEAAARAIHREVWGGPYTRGEGPMHWAGGPYWREKLLSFAETWESRAASARLCAQYLPGEDAP